MDLAIVMPAYNEAGCIEQVALNWLTIVKKLEGMLIVVNDGSKDETGTILDKLAEKEPLLRVVHKPNGGHGSAVIRAYEEALKTGARYVFQTDSDDQFQPADFWKLWERRAESPFILGFREVRHDVFLRKVITRTNRTLNLLLYGVYLKDANIPFRLIKAEYLSELLRIIPEGVFAPNIFLSILASKAGAKLFDIPITHVERKTGKVSIVGMRLIKACFRSARELCQFRMKMFSERAQIRTLRSRYALS
jgi:dolichol-phosphate mannosyltransferase